LLYRLSYGLFQWIGGYRDFCGSLLAPASAALARRHRITISGKRDNSRGGGGGGRAHADLLAADRRRLVEEEDVIRERGRSPARRGGAMAIVEIPARKSKAAPLHRGQIVKVINMKGQ
jgi:Domain of unknown function (DUF1989)